MRDSTSLKGGITTMFTIATTTPMGVFDDIMRGTFGTATTARNYTPSIDVRAKENELVFLCDVPGVKQEDLDITLENHVLTIKGSRKYDGHESDRQVLLGRSYGSFTRSYTLPDNVNDDVLTASLADGVLTIRIPKQPKAKPRKIQISGGGGPQLNE